MKEQDIIVIGGSAGALRALRELVSGLSPNFPAVILVVLHSSPDSPRVLPDIISAAGPLQARYASNGEKAQRSQIYIAPPDCHMLIDADSNIQLTHGPKENRFRPAIDPLFRSAALAFGRRVVGIVLSGGLDDGAGGLGAIKSSGGTAIVQDPMDAEVSSMPRSALRSVSVDYTLPAAQIAPHLERLARQARDHNHPTGGIPAMVKKGLEIEVSFAREREGHHPELLELGNPSMLACPECHGVLLRIFDEKLLRFRCHTGHAFTAQSLLAALTENTEEALWNAIRALEESAMLLGHMADHVPAEEEVMIQQFRKRSKEALAQACVVRGVLSTEPITLPVNDRPAIPSTEASTEGA